MNWDQLHGQWHQVTGSLKSHWGKLTDDDLQLVAGKKEALIGKLQERYGMLKSEADKRADEWLAKLPTMDTKSEGKLVNGK